MSKIFIYRYVPSGLIEFNNKSTLKKRYEILRKIQRSKKRMYEISMIT